MSLDSFLSTIVRLLEEAGVPYMLTGSLAAAYYSSPRATQDLDLVIDPTAEQVERLVESFVGEGFYVSRDAAEQAFRARGQFSVIDPGSGWKADLILRKDRPFSVSEFGRRTEATLLGMEIPLTSLEDLIIAKLEWSELGGSELQRRDILQLMESAGAGLDRAHIENWVRQLGLESAWDRVSGQA